MFYCWSVTLRYLSLSPFCLITYILNFFAIISHTPISHTKHVDLFFLLRSGLETDTVMIQPPFGDLCSLFSKLFICDETASLSVREFSLMCWASDNA